jgi:uncharacterized membrane protein YfcA
MDDLALIGAVLFLACLAQSVTGFGLAIVGMPLLRLLGVPTALASPLVAFVALSLRPLMLYHYWQAFRWRDIWRLVVASVLGIPLGVWLVRVMSEDFASALMGVVLIAYAAHRIFGGRVTARLNVRWGYVAGFLAGVLGGAYNIFGPPAIVYASAQGWEKEAFKANLQAFALAISVLTSGAHALSGNLTPDLLALLLIGVPCAVFGMVLGFWLDPFISKERFGQVITVFLVVMGVSLML